MLTLLDVGVQKIVYTSRFLYTKKIHLSVGVCRPCARAMLIFSVSFQCWGALARRCLMNGMCGGANRRWSLVARHRSSLVARRRLSLVVGRRSSLVAARWLSLVDDRSSSSFVVLDEWNALWGKCMMHGALCMSLQPRRKAQSRCPIHVARGHVNMLGGNILQYVCHVLPWPCTKNWLHFSICACHPCAGAMLIFSVSFQF